MLLVATRCKVPHVCEMTHREVLADSMTVVITECIELDVVLWNQLFGLHVKCTTQIELNALRKVSVLYHF